ncbi:DedA family protein [bacterium]|nr:DedA family protein [bacterium]
MTPDEFSAWFPDGFTDWPVSGQWISIVFSTFVSEDLTCIGAALATVAGSLPLWVAWSGAFVGIWLGDALLYGFARLFGDRLRRASWTKRFLDSPKIRDAETWFSKRGLAVLWICRWIPGTRLPSYLAAGFVRLPIGSFLLVTGIMAFVWTVLIFVLASLAGAAMGNWLSRVENGVLGFLILGIGLYTLVRVFQRSPWWPSLDRLQLVYDQWSRWEFWPAWLFYIPVGIFYLFLSCKYRGVGVPTLSNPGIETGGMIGESKVDLLASLMVVAPDHTAEAYLIEGETCAGRVENLRALMAKQGVQFPIIIKPDVGQRGSGVRKVGSLDEAAVCLSPDGFRQIVQAYAVGPCEAGVFYYRYPGESVGKIFAITDKQFPELRGDGQRSLSELIEADERARMMRHVYQLRFRERLEDVLSDGERFRLVEAGNHAQGCIFLDGMALWSELLESRIDEISQGLDGFFVGRYDIRYESHDALRERAEFQIVELNGASSEATSIYDPKNSLLRAYCTLFQQWEIVFSIGAANRALGLKSLSAWQILKLWRRYQVEAREHLVAD